MKTSQSLHHSTPKWLKITFAVSIYIFCLTFVPWSNFLATKYYGGSFYYSLIGYFLPVVANVFQYLAVVLFLIVATTILMQKRDGRTIVFLAAHGLVTLLFVVLCSILREAIQPMIPTGRYPSENIDNWTLYITCISGLIAIILGIGNRFAAGRKAKSSQLY